MFSLPLEQLQHLKVSIGSKNDETIRNSPSSVTIFTRDDIDKMGVSSWVQLINQVPGFYSMMNSVEGNQSHIVMRGHAQTYANTLLVLLNGHRINDDYTGGINYLIQFMDLADVKRVEIIRGPGSAVYGSNAFSGVINILTEPRKNLTVELGEFDMKKLLVNYSKPIGQNDWIIGTSLSISGDNGDQFDHVFDRNDLQSKTQDPKENQQVRAYLSNKSTRIFGQFLNSKREDYYLFRRLRDGVNKLETKHLMLGVNHKLIRSDTTSLEVSAGYQRAHRESIGALTPKGEAPFEDVDFLFGVRLKYDSMNVNLDYKHQLSESLTLNSGLSYSESQVPNANIKSNFDIYGDFAQLPKVTLFDGADQSTVLDNKRRVSSAYLQTQWQVSSALKVTTGLRFDGYNDIKNATTPRLGIIYRLDDKQTLKYLFGKAYRAPSLGDLYDEESGLTIGSDQLKASEIITSELIYFRAMQKSQFIATFFSNKQTNIIGYQADGKGNQALANVASNDVEGMELEYVYHPIKDLRLNASFSHLWKNETYLGDSTLLPKSEDVSAKNLMNFNAFYQYQDWSFNLNGSWRSDVNVLNDGGLMLLNGNIKKRLNQNMTISFKVTNLLDENYFTSSHTSLGNDIGGNEVRKFPARGRQALLAFTYDF